MKAIPLFALVLLSACATHPRPVLSLKPLPRAEPASVRLPEVIQQYHVGRLVDLENPEVMHEAHPFYRVEAEARWDLRPGAPGNRGGVAALDPAFSPLPVTDAIQAEVHRQRAATERVMEEGTRLAQSYTELQGVIAQLKEVAREHAGLRARVQALEESNVTHLSGSHDGPERR